MPKGTLNKRYTPECKKRTIETMGKGRLGYGKTARQFEINDYMRSIARERIYLTERPGALKWNCAAEGALADQRNCRKRQEKTC